MKLKLTAYQALMAILIFILSYFVWDKHTAVSVLLGASVAIIPNFIFMHLYFSRSSSGQPQLMLRKFYIGEIIKIMMTIILFVVVFQWYGLIPLPFLLSFSGFLLTYWLFLLL